MFAIFLRETVNFSWNSFSRKKFILATKCTVLKFHNFSITQNLREINFWDSRSAKSVILTHLEALNFDFNKFLYFLKAENYQIKQVKSPKMAKTAFLELLDSPKLISRKIWITEKFKIFHAVKIKQDAQSEMTKFLNPLRFNFVNFLTGR